MSRIENIVELDRLLARQRLILEQLRIHLEGLEPRSSAAIQARLLVAETIGSVRSLEAKKLAIIRGSGMRVLH
jgi:hypothetical protein